LSHNIKEQKVKKVKPVEFKRVKEWEVEKILNKRKNKKGSKVFSIIKFERKLNAEVR